MIIKIKRFGEILTSRPEGREAALSLLSSDLRQIPSKISLDFSGVAVMTPSWLGEFIHTLGKSELKEIEYLHLENASIRESVKITKLML